MDNMSDLQRSFMKAQLSKLPPDAPLMEEAEEGMSSTSALDEEKEESSSVSSASSTGTIVPSPSKNLFARSKLYVHFATHPS
jgi:protein phosphatase methylesterase 1